MEVDGRGILLVLLVVFLLVLALHRNSLHRAAMVKVEWVQVEMSVRQAELMSRDGRRAGPVDAAARTIRVAGILRALTGGLLSSVGGRKFEG